MNMNENECEEEQIMLKKKNTVNLEIIKSVLKVMVCIGELILCVAVIRNRMTNE